MTSSFDPNLYPASYICMFGNRQKTVAFILDGDKTRHAPILTTAFSWRISRTFTRQSFEIISWTFWTISRVAALTGRLSWMDVRPRLNSFTQLYIVYNDSADVPWISSNSAFIYFDVLSFI